MQSIKSAVNLCFYRHSGNPRVDAIGASCAAASASDESLSLSLDRRADNQQSLISVICLRSKERMCALTRLWSRCAPLSSFVIIHSNFNKYRFRANNSLWTSNRRAPRPPTTKQQLILLPPDCSESLDHLSFLTCYFATKINHRRIPKWPSLKRSVAFWRTLHLVQISLTLNVFV
jgi:hypothetical protein